MKRRLLLLQLMIGISAAAQKLPHTQEKGVWVPAKIVIDGKAAEWPAFEAYNKLIYYTIANDNENLYLVVHAKDEGVISKILFGGITLTMNGFGKKTKETEVSITFPNILGPPSVATPGSRPMEMSSQRYTPAFGSRPLKTGNEVTYRHQVDSFITARNKQMESRFKQIGVTGVADFPDAVVSVYNEDGIKAVAKLDQNFTYTYEMKFPLKYLNRKVAGETFAYNICLNGAGKDIVVLRLSEEGGEERIIYSRGNSTYPVSGPGISQQIFPTDFSGEYTLAKN